MLNQTLWCEAGHEWTRASQRGRPPRLCPEHQEAPEQPVERPETRANSARVSMPAPEIWEALGAEDRRKVEYIVAQINSGKRHPGDVQFLAETMEAIVDRAERRQYARAGE